MFIQSFQCSNLYKGLKIGEKEQAEMFYQFEILPLLVIPEVNIDVPVLNRLPYIFIKMLDSIHNLRSTVREVLYTVGVLFLIVTIGIFYYFKINASRKML